MINLLSGILYFLVALGILVAIHELGHFLAAKACKVKVLRFSLGFGPIIFKKTGQDGCEYALSAIPLGGYVKMEGENQPVEGQDAVLPPDSFKAKPVWQRAIIIFAGPFFNIFLAVILFTAVNMSGVTQRYAVIGDVVPGSIAEQSELRVFDRINSIDGQETATWSDVIFALVENIGSDHSMSLEVASDLGKGEHRKVSLNLKDFELKRNESPLDLLGIKVCVGNITSVIGSVLENSPAQRAGLEAGDRIVSINGVEVSSWYRLQDEITRSSGKILDLVVERNGSLYSAQAQPDLKYDKNQKISRPFLGIAAKVESLEGLSSLRSYGFTEALIKGVNDAVNMSKLVIVSAYKLINGSISADNISGPIAIAKGAQESAAFGLKIFISFLAAISVNLGILNLIPIPVLDGGQLVFLAYEAVMRREPSAKVQAVLTSVGAALLLTLTLFAIFNDIKGL